MSKEKKVAEHLRVHKNITPITAIALYGAYRLSAIIFILRAKGWKIGTKTALYQDMHKNRVKTGCYYIISEPIIKKKVSHKKKK